MSHQHLLAKLQQIIEQAQLTLQDPSLLSERQRMIIALARFVSNEMARPGRFEFKRPELPPPLV